MHIRNLQVLSYAMGFNHWLYKTGDVNEVLKPNYLNDASGMMMAGDLLTISSPNGVAQRCVLKPFSGVVSLCSLS